MFLMKTTLDVPEELLETVQPVTLRSFFDLLRRAERPDEDFARDLEEVQAAQPAIGEGPWPS